ncbi:hypothetical protein ANO14919_058720 [Xylariales sp. No.14919]|nr:hypothetical protein ANO14919_058720 [Xylariales sp. No.14919]
MWYHRPSDLGKPIASCGFNGATIALALQMPVASESALNRERKQLRCN